MPDECHLVGVGDEREKDSLDKQTEEEVIQRRWGGGGVENQRK